MRMRDVKLEQGERLLLYVFGDTVKQDALPSGNRLKLRCNHAKRSGESAVELTCYSVKGLVTTQLVNGTQNSLFLAKSSAG